MLVLRGGLTLLGTVFPDWTNPANWTLLAGFAGTISFVGGRIRLTSTGATNVAYYLQSTTTLNQRLRASANLFPNTLGCAVNIGEANDGNAHYGQLTSSGSVDFNANLGTGIFLTIIGTGASGAGQIAEFSNPLMQPIIL